MKAIQIKFTDFEGKVTKTYSTMSVKTGLIDKIFDIAEKAEDYETGKLGLPEAKQFFKDLKTIIVEVFGKQFSYDELNENVEQSEIIHVFTSLCENIGGAIAKN